MKQPITHQEKIEWYPVLHKQNLSGRETEDELFELGISAGIKETEELQDDYAIEFAEWCKQEYDVENTSHHNKWLDVPGAYLSTRELLEIYKETL